MLMKWKNVLLWLLLFWGPIAFAADEHRISLEKHFFDLRRTGIIIEKVIDARTDTFCVGFAQKGIGNKKVPAFLDRGVVGELEALFSRSLADREKGLRLTLRINHLYLFEVPYGNRQVAVAEINVSFLEREGDAYRELYEVGSSAERYGIDVTGGQAKNIVKALETCINQFSARQKAGRLWARLVPPEQLGTWTLQPDRYAALSTRSYPRGVYASFGDFRDNTPDSTLAFSVTYDKPDKDGQVTARLEWNGDQPEEQGAWGFSDGRDVYIHLGRRYYRLNREGDAFSFLARAPETGAGSAWGGILGGVIGSLLVTALEYSTKENMTYRVNFATGAIIPENQPPSYRRAAARTYFCFSKFEKSGARLSILVNGEERCTLSPGEYFLLWTPPGVEQVEVCFRSTDGTSCQVILPELFNKDLFLCRLKRGGGPAIDHPNLDIRSELYRNIRDGELQERCAE